MLKLGPKERVLINGAVVENGDRRTRFSILSSNARVLRLKDAIHPDDANTPVKRICFLVQLMLSGDMEVGDAELKVRKHLSSLREIFQDETEIEVLNAAELHLERGNHYASLKALRNLMPRESVLLGRVDQ